LVIRKLIKPHIVITKKVDKKEFFVVVNIKEIKNNINNKKTLEIKNIIMVR